MPLYRIADLTLRSTCRLPGVPAAVRSDGAWTFRIERRARPARPRRWYHHAVAPDGARWRSLARIGDAHVVRFDRQAVFTIAQEVRRIVCYPGSGLPADAVRQLLLGQVLPLVLGGPGRLVLHASAAQTAHGVVAFAGPTGFGKSTLTAALAAAGCPLVADDCLIVDVEAGCRARPLDLGMRLHPDAARLFRPHLMRRRRTPARKQRFAAASLGFTVSADCAELRQVYLLAHAERAAPRAAPVPRSDAVIALLASSFQLGMDDPRQVREAFELLTALASRVTVRRFAYARRLDRLRATAGAVLEDAGRA